jgi:hypothetical protein
MRSNACPAHLVFLDLITPERSGEEYKLEADPVAALAFSTRTLDRGVKSRLRAGTFILGLSVLCRPMQVQALRRDDHSITELTVCRTLIKKPLVWPCAPEGVSGNIHT